MVVNINDEAQLYFAIVDIEKTFDRISRVVTRWALKQGTDWPVSGTYNWYRQPVKSVNKHFQPITAWDSRRYRLKPATGRQDTLTGFR